MKQTIGLMMVVRNEAHRLLDCLDHHLPYVDEIAICDQESTDGTWQIIQEYQAKSKIPFYALQDKPHGYCEPSKQLTANQLKTDWILYLDPDEKFPKEFLEKMHEIVETGDADGYTFPRNNIFLVQVYDESVPIIPKWLRVRHPSRDYQLRLTRKSKSWFPEFLHNRVRVEGRNIKKLGSAIDHIKTITEQWEDQKRYNEAKK